MQRYFFNEPYQNQSCFEATAEMYHHMVHVMRMQVGDEVYLAFTNQQVIIAEIVEITAQTLWLKEVAKESQQKELPIEITIASGYPKGDKLEWIVQKGTELGAHQFIGFPASSSVVKWDAKKLAKKAQRLTKIAQEAAEQSHRQVVPTIQLLDQKVSLERQLADYDMVLVAYEESAKQGEKAMLAQVFNQLTTNQRLLVIFGPEGGLTPQEVDQFEEKGAVLCGLGPRILRTETAPLYLLAAASYHFELNG
ncbi:16S rRNA (uracil(1498)-N(3))-methyltransferase [Enterococcus columbae]|uniref:Ribosomal RNA small subunit methyltransferase E n=1 Tax=Enterococcus columbae DSM 7374 = ATCC 51263 TaxID=1121865 RepID=S0K7L1_9ENTE|nr:16S rRNA (uracil(1498)-N(3))-methyltransferase [Enterococcus columbae]EOT40587.1 16S ribosomal RNA methyltransferase RsmE [Enterococcus columbae DSM 7374 = ATCC 51263]EOW80363.1 16S ribosomal RNA methyltransferase RsmE [Enterococcus columbae DSM 7374 = ATCC 51263]OJG24250.1 16S ribosomal RNA methyltransferase RsmE [Enterococcus columbae DSM 7374 = ATCC 51263]